MKEQALNLIEKLIMVAKTKEGPFKIFCLCEAHGMAIMANEMGIISNKEMKIITDITVAGIMEGKQL